MSTITKIPKEEGDLTPDKYLITKFVDAVDENGVTIKIKDTRVVRKNGIIKRITQMNDQLTKLQSILAEINALNE